MLEMRCRTVGEHAAALAGRLRSMSEALDSVREVSEVLSREFPEQKSVFDRICARAASATIEIDQAWAWSETLVPRRDASEVATHDAVSVR
jgi:Ni,Fe-hydrogenase I large subunit